MGSETFTIDGKEMKKCPGWSGNSFRCGRGNPRLIGSDKDVCENCSRGMRKAGQRSREEAEEEARRLQAKKDKIALGVVAFERALGGPPVTERDAITNVLEALEELTNADLGETYHHTKDDEIVAGWKLEILYACVGKEQPEPKRKGYR